jgi:hypothetical protein
VKARYLSLARPAHVLAKDLILVEEYLVALLANDEPMVLAPIEPLDRAPLLGHRTSPPEAPET